jgi:SAM-dependent methyltransferase
MRLADAAVWQAGQDFDVIMSRFGVMFFDDPQAAFTNIGTNLKSGGRLAFACWQAPMNNAWVLTPMMAIKPFLPETPAPDPHAPGPFAFADPERLHGILAGAGFEDISITAHDVPITLALAGGVERAVEFSMQIGPAAKAMAEVDEGTKAEMRAALIEALRPHEKNDQVALGGGIFIVTAIRKD